MFQPARERRHMLAVALSAALLVAACGNSPAPSGPAGSAGVPSTNPAPSAGTTASAAPASALPTDPSSAPSASADPVAALEAVLRGSAWSGHATVSGTLTRGSTPYAVAGTFEVSGAEVHEVRTAKLAGAGAGEWETHNGTRYALTTAGLWFPQPAVDATADLRTFLRTPIAFTDLGPSTSPGPAEHFQIVDASLGPRAFGLAGLTVANPRATIDVFASAGIPTQIDAAAAWTSMAGGKKTPVKVALTYAFDPAAQVAIAAPGDVWTMATSKLFRYRIGYPATWDANPSTTKKYVDQYESIEYRYVTGARDRSLGSSLSSIANYYKTHSTLTGWKQVQFVSMKSLTIDGAPARRVITKAVEGTDKLWVITYFTIRSGWAYTINVIDQRGHEDADARLAAQVISTFRFP
jgi:hypothetical protein